MGPLTERVEQLEERANATDTTTYKLHRSVVRTNLMLDAIAQHFGIALPTDAEVEAALDEQ